jgi:alpha-tubulin suppressor-like RCC1 family protein
MATAYGHCLVVSKEGRLYSFGTPGSRFSLGHGLDRDQPFCPLEMLKPQLVTALQGVRVLAVAAGGCHSLALSETGEVYSFGGCHRSPFGYGAPLGHGGDEEQLTPVVIPGLKGVHSVSAGECTSFAVTNGGVVYSWGGWCGAPETWPDYQEPQVPGPPVLGLLTDRQCAPRQIPSLQCLVHT